MIPTVGNIYCAYSEQLQQYTACQVTALQEKDGKHSSALVSIVQLDWSGDHMLRSDELAELKPLICDFYFWNDELDHRFVEATVPMPYHCIGNIPPLVTEPCITYDTNWDIGDSLYKQRQWEAIDEQQRLRFKQARNDQRETSVGHQTVKKSTSTLRNFKPESAADVDALRQLHCLTHIEMDYFTEAMIPFLEQNRFVNELHISHHDLTTLDLSQTHLTRLVLYQGSLNRLILNQKMEWLSLTDQSAVELHIDAKQAGRNLTLSVAATVPLLKGIHELGALYIRGIKHMDLSIVSTTYAALKQLRLWGKPGTLSGLRSIEQLASLQCLTTFDLFGFVGADFPDPAQMPKLQMLWLTSLPADAAKSIKARYAKLSPIRIDLDISKPRKAEWLAENLDNPFRDWDGRASIRSKDAKKASALYKRCLKQIREWSQQTFDDNSNSLNDRLVTMIETYTETFNTMDARSAFIDTIEREEIYAALMELLHQLEQQLALHTTNTITVDLQALSQVFERTRQF